MIGALNSFSDELLVSLCEFLPAFSVISLNLTCTILNSQIADSAWLWRKIAESFLGKTLFQTHLTHRLKDNQENIKASFYKSLFFECMKCEGFVYAHDLRTRCLNNVSMMSDEGVLFGASGHTATAIGNKIVIIGGWQGHTHQHTVSNLSICIVDVAKTKVVQPELDPSSYKPGCMLRHSACSIANPSWLNSSSECLLVVGGRDFLRLHDYTGGVHDCLLLEFLNENTVKWHKLNTGGQAPLNIWHHSSCSFQNRKKVVIFGGDIPEHDNEYSFISNRMEVSHVYVLDVELKIWSRVVTSGDMPSWRSLHVGVTYCSIVDNRERLVVVGGTSDHIQVFESGSTTDFNGYALDLDSMVWSRGQSPWFGYALEEAQGDEEGSFHPSPRMRFSAEVYGRHLVVYGGHDNFQPIPDKLIKLDLLSLKWSHITVKNEPYSYPDAVSSQLAGGLLVGGIFPRSMTTCEKFDFLLLDDT